MLKLLLRLSPVQDLETIRAHFLARFLSTAANAAFTRTKLALSVLLFRDA